MPKTMASLNLLPSLLLLFATSFLEISVKAAYMIPFKCSEIQKCNASLYYTTNNLQTQQIAFYYSVNTSQIKPIFSGTSTPNYLITVPCSCHSELQGYFYDTTYKVKQNDTFQQISSLFYNGQALPVDGTIRVNDTLPIHLFCGCSEKDSQMVVTYTVQPSDTPSDIADRLNASLAETQRLNPVLERNVSFIDVGWVLYVPMELNGPPSPQKAKQPIWKTIVGILAGLTVLSVITMIILVIVRKRAKETRKEDPRAPSKRSFAHSTHSLKNSSLHKEIMEDTTPFESERPAIYSLEEIEEATNNFNESRRIGVGGYGSVYFGILGEKEVAIKKMRSNKSREFFAELKVLCKIHHINIVELLGYASGEDHLYLVYEFVSNGSLGDHLHDPLLKGHQPLSWTARAQIAMDAARGLEYIHDYTKARYVHRDIKTCNILLDEKLRAKVADFGLAKLVERKNDEEFLATRLVGTPGYLPPESVKELQITPKTDVFAFGVVLAELVTGKRALFRDSQDANMKSLISVVTKIFQDDNPETALENVIDANLGSIYPIEDVYKMAEIAEWCMREDPLERPEMREIIGTLSQLVMSSIAWEASLGGNSQVFSGIFDGR